MAVGFGQGGPLDQLPPGPALAAFLAEASDGDAETAPAPRGHPPPGLQSDRSPGWPSAMTAR